MCCGKWSTLSISATMGKVKSARWGQLRHAHCPCGCRFSRFERSMICHHGAVLTTEHRVVCLSKNLSHSQVSMVWAFALPIYYNGLCWTILNAINTLYRQFSLCMCEERSFVMKSALHAIHKNVQMDHRWFASGAWHATTALRTRGAIVYMRAGIPGTYEYFKCVLRHACGWSVFAAAGVICLLRYNTISTWCLMCHVAPWFLVGK